MNERTNSLKLPISLDAVLRGKSVEWERLEYKAGWNPGAVLHTVCAFANDFHNLGGGYIVIGVADDGGRPVLPPVGLAPPEIDAIQKELLKLGHSAIRPMYHPLSAPCEVDGKWILVIWVPGGETRPYKAKVSLSGKKGEWAYYIRKQSSTVRARGADERELIGLAATVPFDDRYNQQASVEDLSPRLIEVFLREVGSDLADDVQSLDSEALGRQMNIVGGPSEAVFPKNVGLLFFNQDPRRFFPATQIDVVWFPDGPGGDRFEEKTFSGPLARMTREALDYVQRNYINETVIKHPDRAEATRVENFPYAAIEEAVTNAVYHRGYDVREPVEVRISRNELVVLSYPGPDRSVRLEELRAGRALPRRYRNRRIGEFLKELDMTEGRSTGIPKILHAMEANGSPPPEFDFDEDHTYFMCRLPAHPQATMPERLTPQAIDRQPISRNEAGLPAGEQVGTGCVPSLSQVCPKSVSTDTVRIVLQTVEPAADLQALMAEVGHTNRTRFRNAVLRPLIASGLIEMTIPDKPRSSKQKYRITEKGRKVLNQE